MIANFKYSKAFRKYPDAVIKEKVTKMLGQEVSEDLLHFLYMNKGGIVEKTNFILDGKRYYVSCIPGFGSKKLMENIEYNYEGITKMYDPGMLEIIQLLDEESILYSLKTCKYYFRKLDSCKIEIASNYFELMTYFEEDV